jgi:hypothetical protein
MKRTFAIVALSIGFGVLGGSAGHAGNVESPWFDQVMMEREIDAKDPWQRAQIKVPSLSTMDPLGISSGDLPGLGQVVGNNSGNDGVLGILGGSSGLGTGNFGALGAVGSSGTGGGLGILGNMPSGNVGFGFGAPLF